MRYLLFLFFVFFITNNYANDKYENESINLLLEIKRNINDKDYAIKLGQHLNQKEYLKLPIKESLRHSAIISNNNRNKLISIMENSGLINKVEKEQILNQVISYNDIVNKMENSVSNIDIEKSYTSYNCTKIESSMYQPNIIIPFKRSLKISDVSAYQDFGRVNESLIKIVHVPSIENVISHISYKENIKFRDFEEKFIANNATAVSMYIKLNANKKTYYMFPFKLYPYETNDLSKLTALEYGYFALNLKLAGLLTPEIYETFKKVYRRNAALCLYSKK